MLTVAELLKMDEWSGAQVVAGAAGLDHPIRWVHNAAVPDAPDWLNGGEFVLTTAINMPQTPEEQCAYLLALVRKNVAGLAIAVGRYIEAIPPYLTDLAEAHAFPLISIPFTLRFVDMVKQANERISQENMAMVTRALHIHQTLTRLVLEGGGLKDLARQLADLIGQSISIENERFEALASENIAQVDEARRYTLQHGRTNPRLVQALEERGVLPEIRRTLRPVFIPQMPDVGLEMERILAPVVVHGELYGYMWIIADDRPLNDLDRLAIESGATIAALMLLHQESIQSAEASLKGSLLSRLIQGEAGHETILNDQTLRYGVDLRAPYALLLIEAASPGGRQLQLYRRINRLAATQRWPVVVGQFAGQVVVLAQAEQIDIPNMAERLHTEVSGVNGEPLRIGVSAIQRGAAQVALAYQQCREVLHIESRLNSASPIVFFERLGYLHTLFQAGPESLLTNPYVPGLRHLLSEQHGDLFATLEAYLDAGGNGVQTAEALHIHRSTLNYRLERIVEVCQVRLSDPLTRTNLQIALKLLRLFETG